MSEQHEHDHCDGDDHSDHGHAFEWPELLRIALVAVAAGLLVGGWPIFKEALENLFAKRMTMDLSMSIAIVAAAGIAEFFTALVITLFVLVAEVLEGMTVSRGRRATARSSRRWSRPNARARRSSGWPTTWQAAGVLRAGRGGFDRLFPSPEHSLGKTIVAYAQALGLTPSGTTAAQQSLPSAPAAASVP
jgi:hypothetical protein